jgi:negative regulator of genetic competence, sporulation and motility
MTKRIKPEEVIEELKENEEFISRDDIEIQVAVSDEGSVVFVAFDGFENDEDAEEYAEFLAETLPLLLFESTRLH